VISLRSCCITDAVTAITGIFAVAGSLRSTPSASMPFMPGSWISISTRSGLCDAARRMPSSAVPASSVR
jgi:hypothetical protein